MPRLTTTFMSDCCNKPYVSKCKRIECTECGKTCKRIIPIISCVECGDKIAKSTGRRVCCTKCAYTHQLNKIKQWRLDNPERYKLSRDKSSKRRIIKRQNNKPDIAFSLCITCKEAYEINKMGTKYCPPCNVKYKRLQNRLWQQGEGRDLHNFYAREYERRKQKEKEEESGRVLER